MRSHTITSRFVYTTSENVPEYMVRGGVTYRLVTDHLGSLRQVVNTSTGAIAEQVEYDEFGNVITDSNPGFVPFGFAGGLYDTQTKLVRFGARDYEAVSGRWLVKDPIRFKSSESDLYAYSSNNPINLTDPNGRFNFKKAIAFGIFGAIQNSFSAWYEGGDVAKSALIGFTAGFVGGGVSFSKSVDNVLFATFAATGGNLTAQMYSGRPGSSVSGAQLAFTGISTLAASAYAEALSGDLAGAALAATIFSSAQQALIGAMISNITKR